MTTLAARSAEWHADRLLTVGASDAPVITGDAPWADLLQLYAVKAGIIDPPDIDNEPTRWGLRLEPVVADWFEEALTLRDGSAKKLRRDNTRPRHPDHPWMATSLDRRVVGERSLVEVKTSRFASDEWGKPWSAEVPAHVIVQVQHEMAVTGAERCYVAALFSGSDPRPYEVPRDDELIADLISLEAEFMDAVRNGTPPEALIRKQRPVIPYREGEIDADETLATGIEGVYHARQEVKALKEQLALAEAAVKTLLGPNTAARAGAYRATYKPNADSHPVRWELVAAAYRKALEKIAADMNLSERLRTFEHLDLDAIESLFTDLKVGARVLRITEAKEARDAA